MTQLLIEGYEADIYEGIGALFTYQIDDVKSFAAKNTSFSKTIVLPATDKNRKLFGFVDNLNINSDYLSGLPNVLSNYNAGVPANCLVLIDSIQIFKGIIRILEITNTNGLIEYQCSVFGELGGFYFNLANKYLNDLDFSDYDQSWTWNNVSTSWNNVGSGAFFGLADYGKCSIASDKKDWKFEAFRPAFFLREYLEKIFDVSKYTVDMSALTNISWFDRLVVPQNQDDVYLPAYLKITNDANTNSIEKNRIIYVNPTTNNLQFVLKYRLKNVYQLPTNTTITISLFRNGSQIATASTTWFATDAAGTSKLIQFTHTETGVNNNDYFYIQISSSINNVLFVYDFQNSVLNNTLKVYLASTGAELGGIIANYLNPPSLIIGTTPYILTGLGFNNTEIPQKINYGGFIDMNYQIPKNIKMTDFVTDILKQFNCMIIENKDIEKGLKIVPYINYYYPLPTAIDWSNKIDQKTAFKIKPMSELNARYYEFRYDVDGDWLNTTYKEKYGIGYGEKIFDSQYQFSKENSVAKVIFSPTPMFAEEAQDKKFPILWKSTDNGATEGRMSTKIRLLFSKFKYPVPNWKFHKNTGTETADYYGYIGHLDDPDTPTIDINWTNPNELYYRFNSVYPNGMFDNYWSAYLAEITHKDSKLLVCNVYLNRIDIKNLDFSKPIYINGVLFRLNKVVDYNSENEGLTKVELLKLNL